ncbi:peptidoglycan D,D-transpeptidase FtsI family protein [Azohydromonas lata]|uniref:Peptidoglycan D,D-transpeptidase FtsI n=1 Tax=Azohydromonas lata TaxID=45677 RepID=A0ABU5IC10_9BURK|nr:penicillin-binding protein 2 [Azohydromonas lata]MDZ5455508.1 penicillin-binding protein 2 [Azohydromonas lata]
MSALRPGPRGAAVSVRSVNYATSPLLASKTPPWRSRFLVALVGVGFTALLARAAYVQIIGTDFFQQQGEKRYVHTLQMPASRGRILDRNGALLATSVAAPSVWAIPKDFEASPAQKAQLAKLLGMGVSDLDKRLAENNNFVWLRRQLDDETWEQIKALNLKGVHQVSEFKRRYPEGEAAAHVVGFTGMEQTGQEGIELAFQRELQGKNGSREVVKDRLGRVIEDVGQQLDPVNGRDIALSIDAKVQFFAYQRIRDAVVDNKAKAGSVVVIDVQTGEVLALANYPSYDPGDRSKLTGNQLRNRALTDTFEPGSTMKPFIIGQSLETGRVRPDTPVVTGPGTLVVSGTAIRDAHPHPVLTVSEVIQKSSNIGSARLAMQMPPKEMWELYSSVGFGQKPQLKFPGAVTGRLRPWKSWKPIEQATMAYGYGLSASLLQIAQAYTAFARDGEVIPVSMFKQDAPQPGTRVFKVQTAQQVRKMLQLVTAPGGTAPQAQVIGYSTGGKSGTAHKQEGRGYASNKYRSWFVGLAPVDKPRVIVAVMVDEPTNGQYFGGAVAGPVFSQVVQQTLRLKGVEPDLDVKTQIVTKAVPAEPESF